VAQQQRQGDEGHSSSSSQVVSEPPRSGGSRQQTQQPQRRAKSPRPELERMEQGRDDVSLSTSSSMSTVGSSSSESQEYCSSSSILINDTAKLLHPLSNTWNDRNLYNHEEHQTAPSEEEMQRITRLKDEQLEKYIARRHMTPLQERMNGITMIPTMVYCFFVILSGSWLKPELIDQTRNSSEMMDHAPDGCIHSTWFPQLHALPPLPVLAVTVGIALHAPFSFIYHFFYAHKLSGQEKLEHWSRRMDQGMIHIVSAWTSYATSGSLEYFLVNLLYNLDCFYRQVFHRKVRPKHNQIRIFISILAYTIPLLRRGDFVMYGKLTMTFAVSGWFFVRYPIGGWSHCMFHLVCSLAPPLLVTVAEGLTASQAQLNLAAQCAVWAEQQLLKSF
jgi:hypothetical protein